MVYWTTTTSDALGRTASVTLPTPTSTVIGTNTNQTGYSYDIENGADAYGTAWLGTRTTITDPAGKLKRYLYDGFGRLIRVDELSPGATAPVTAANLIETARYAYDPLGHMTQVQMPYVRNGTRSFQTRTFNYNAVGQLTSS